MNRYEGFTLYSDVDNTLLTKSWGIPERNIEALTRFTEEGGRFALATGRGPTQRTFDLLEKLPMINIPCIFLNGGLLFDSKKRETIVFHALPDSIRETILEICREYPNWPVTICTRDDRFQVGPDVEPQVSCKNIRDVALPWGKILFHVSAKTRVEAMEWLKARALAGADITASDETLVEIVPHGVSKGAALEDVIARYRLDRSKVAAIGDYFNDMDMLTVPGIRTFCPANAAPEIKAVCETTVCSVQDGALADAIEHLGRGV